MATATDRDLCNVCRKARGIANCIGCQKIFCYHHFGDHRQELDKELNEVEVHRDLFQQTLNGRTAGLKQHPLIQQIEQWERESIKKIRQNAAEATESILKLITTDNNRIITSINRLTDQLRHSRQESDFVEMEIRQWKEDLVRLQDELNKPSNITIRQDSKSFVTKIYADFLMPIRSTNIDDNARWTQDGLIIAGEMGKGNGLNQICYPWGTCVDDQTVYVADWENHRIVEWKCGATSGQIVAGGIGSGNQNDQLSGPTDVIVDRERNYLIICDYSNQRVVRWPRQNGTCGQTIISNINCYGLTMDNDGYLYVSDCEKHEVRRWRIGDAAGTLVAGGNGHGNGLNQLSSPYYIYVDQERSVYVSDYANHRVMKWMENAKEGIVVAGGQGQGNGLTQLSYPYGVVVDQRNTVYVADGSNHRVMCWKTGAKSGSIVVGGNGHGMQSNQLYCPKGLSFDRQGNIYVAEWNNHRVQKFNIDLSLNS